MKPDSTTVTKVIGCEHCLVEVDPVSSYENGVYRWHGNNADRSPDKGTVTYVPEESLYFQTYGCYHRLKPGDKVKFDYTVASVGSRKGEVRADESKHHAENNTYAVPIESINYAIRKDEVIPVRWGMIVQPLEKDEKVGSLYRPTSTEKMLTEGVMINKAQATTVIGQNSGWADVQAGDTIYFNRVEAFPHKVGDLDFYLVEPQNVCGYSRDGEFHALGEWLIGTGGLLYGHQEMINGGMVYGHIKSGLFIPSPRKRTIGDDYLDVKYAGGGTNEVEFKKKGDVAIARIGKFTPTDVTPGQKVIYAPNPGGHEVNIKFGDETLKCVRYTKCFWEVL